jgi:hypothetical protein
LFVDRQVMAILLLCFATLAGCGSRGETARKPMQGKVEQGGRPVEAGAISFLPAEGHAGPAANGAIAGGRYRFTTGDGPVAGPHRVLIDVDPADVNAGKAAVGAAKVEPLPGGPDTNPSRRKWEFQMTVPSESPYEKDFQLE